MARNRLTVFDTTLRDGEQAPGFSMRIHEKVRLARQLDALGVDLIEAFAPLPEGGASHPTKNARRPTMKLAVQPDVPVLLIDDVATSGAHIEEASMLLRKSAPAVLPMVWIAD